jgi:uncharacterized delta-60 repeat protein
VGGEEMGAVRRCWGSIEPRVRRLFVAIVAIAMTVPLALPDGAWAAPGDLDASFGTGGLVTHTSFSVNDGGNLLAFQSDGKIVLAGYVLVGPAERTRFAVARFDANGMPDPTFGGDGVVRTRFRTGPRCLEQARSVLVRPGGTIVAIGSSSCPRSEPRAGSDSLFAVASFEPDGSLTPSFGTGGKVLTNFGSAARCSASGEAAALVADGTVVVAGTASCRSIDPRFALARYLPDGSLDPSFGGNGKVRTNLTPQEDRLSDVLIQPDGKIVASGTAAYWVVEIPDALESRAALVRYESDGSLDPTFGGGDGKVTTSFHSRLCPGANESYGIALQADGRIVEGGSAACSATVGAAPHPRWVLARYRSDGRLDRTFGRDGRVVTIWSAETWGDWMWGGVAVQPNGRILAAGTAGRNISRFTVARYRPTGRLDPSFGDDGRVRTTFGSGPACGDGVWDAAEIQPDGRIVVAGGGGCLRSFVMARFLRA